MEGGGHNLEKKNRRGVSKKLRRGGGCSELGRNTIFYEHPVSI